MLRFDERRKGYVVMMLEMAPVPSFRIFPLHGIIDGACTCTQGAECKSIGKHPLVRWREYDENTKGPSGGYGIQTGHFNGVFVVDLDVSDKKNGIASLTALGDVPDTLSVLTPSGGVHLYFRLPPDLHVPCSRSELGPGIDIKGEGGYVVGPGSPHKRGGFYQEVPEAPLADAPEWLLEKVVKQPATPKVSSVALRVVPERVLPDSMELVISLLAKAWPATGRHPAQLALAGALCRDGWSEADAVEILCAVCRAAGDEDRPKRTATCRDTWAKAGSGALFTGWRELSKFVGDGVVSAARTMLKSKTEQEAQERFRQTVVTGPKVVNPAHEYSYFPGMRCSGETRKASFGEILADLFDHKDWAGVLTYDTFRDRIIAINPPTPMDAEHTSLTDNDVRAVRGWFEYHGKKPNPTDVQGAIETVARRLAFNSVQDMLRSLRWDGVPRLDRVLPNYFESPDGPYERAVGPRWFISLVARAMTPGCQSDCTLILEQRQHGVGKTRAFRSLMRNPHWYAESSCGMDSKDFLEGLRGIWLVGFDELDSLTRSSLTKVKTVLTQLHDHYRKSYGHNAGDYPRACGFCGTTNAEQYLNDLTGGRRFWPVRVRRAIDTKRIERDRDQLWAEAFVRWEAGEVWHVDTPELRALCEAEQEDRLEPDGWEEIISRWFDDPTKFSPKPVAEEPNSVFKGVRAFDGSKGVSTADVLEHAVGKLRGNWTRGDSMRVGSILRHLGMECVQIRLKNGARERRYINAETVNKTDQK